MTIRDYYVPVPYDHPENTPPRLEDGRLLGTTSMPLFHFRKKALAAAKTLTDLTKTAYVVRVWTGVRPHTMASRAGRSVFEGSRRRGER